MRLGELISKAEVERCGDKQLPVLSMTMHDGIVRQRDRFKKAIASKDTSNYRVVYPQQLVVGFPIDEGVIYVQNFDEPGIMSPAYNVWDIDTTKVHPAYLELALHSPQTMTYYEVQMKGTTARRRTLSKDKLRDIKVVLPPPEKQLQVARLFQQVKELLRANKARETALDSLVKSRFVEMFGGREWPKRQASSFMRNVRNGVSPSKNGECHARVLTLSALTQGSFDASAYKEGAFKDTPPADKRITKGLFCICRGNGNKALVGTAEYAESDDPQLVFPDTVIAAEIDQSVVCLPYLAASWKRPSTRVQIEARARTTNGTFKINQEVVRSIELPLPPLALQREFADFAARVDKLRFMHLVTAPDNRRIEGGRLL